MTHESLNLGLDFRPTTRDAFRRRREAAPNPQLTPQFAARVFEVTSQMDADTLAASLLIYSEAKRLSILNDLGKTLGRCKRQVDYALKQGDSEWLMINELHAREVEGRIIYVNQLSEPPQSWQKFMERIKATEKMVLMKAIGGSLKDKNRYYDRYGIESTKTVGDFRQIDVNPEFTPDSQVPMTDIFLSLAFKGSA